MFVFLCLLLAYFLGLKTMAIFLIIKTKLLDLEENNNALQGVLAAFVCPCEYSKYNRQMLFSLLSSPNSCSLIKFQFLKLFLDHQRKFYEL